MAMRAPGEIKALTQIAPPDISVITNIAPVHLQFFKSIEEIALAKKEILEGTKALGIAIFNWDDPWIRKIAKDWKGDKLRFGSSSECDVRALNIQQTGWEGLSFELGYGQKLKKIHFPFFYESYLYNFLAAATISYALSVPLADILTQVKTLKPFSMRGTVIILKRNIKLIDDSYNSNPKGLESVLKGLAGLPSKRKIVILADMLELGEQEIDYHAQAGRLVFKLGYDILITVGSLSQHIKEGALSSGMRRDQIFSFKDSEEAAKKIWPLLKEDDLVLVKGSRGMKTETIVENLKTKGS
jgi:UDP-N-acetylmuramoyl-tripeptide--D-alanyl-D-alanine ligase